MNRIQFWTHKVQATSSAATRVEQSLLSIHDDDPQYTIFAPLHYEKNYAYPLVVWLHGPGDDERQVQRIMPLVSMRNYVAVGPRGDCRAEGKRAGYDWSQAEDSVDAAEQRVFECMSRAERRYHVAPRRVFLAGFQSGGTMAFRLGLRHPGTFAGVLSIGGPFPTGDRPLCALDQSRKLPLFIAQGRDSTQYPVAVACHELRLFHAAGLCVTVRQYPCGDELVTQMLHDMNVWMMELVTGVSHTPETHYAGEDN